MIYVDSSVLLAHLLAEDVQPHPSLWADVLVTSRLTAFEAWTRIHARGLSRSHGEDMRQVLGRLAFVEMASPVLGRALEPWPVAVRTLDALHLAAMAWLRAQRQEVVLASFDARLTDAAERLGFTVWAGTTP